MNRPAGRKATPRTEPTVYPNTAAVESRQGRLEQVPRHKPDLNGLAANLDADVEVGLVLAVLFETSSMVEPCICGQRGSARIDAIRAVDVANCRTHAHVLGEQLDAGQRHIVCGH